VNSAVALFDRLDNVFSAAHDAIHDAKSLSSDERKAMSLKLMDQLEHAHNDADVWALIAACERIISTYAPFQSPEGASALPATNCTSKPEDVKS
jgi:hypothetical protein